MRMSARPIEVVFAVLVLGAAAAAQDLSRSSMSRPNPSSAVGAQVSDQVEAFAEGVPQLQQVDRQGLRDTGTRGDFVGADSADTGLFGGTGPQGTRATGTARSTQRAIGRGTVRQGQAQPRAGRSTATSIRPTLTLGFSYTPQPSPHLVRSFSSSLERIPRLNGGDCSVRVVVEEGGVVVLEGTVPTVRDRLLSEQLVALSPGVLRIENRLAVAAASPVPAVEP